MFTDGGVFQQKKRGGGLEVNRCVQIHAVECYFVVAGVCASIALVLQVLLPVISHRTYEIIISHSRCSEAVSVSQVDFHPYIPNGEVSPQARCNYLGWSRWSAKSGRIGLVGNLAVVDVASTDLK